MGWLGGRETISIANWGSNILSARSTRAAMRSTCAHMTRQALVPLQACTEVRGSEASHT